MTGLRENAVLPQCLLPLCVAAQLRGLDAVKVWYLLNACEVVGTAREVSDGTGGEFSETHRF